MNNVIIHGPEGDEFNTDIYEYYANSNRLKVHNPNSDNSWVVIEDVDIKIDVTGFLIEITYTYRHNLNFS